MGWEQHQGADRGHCTDACGDETPRAEAVHALTDSQPPGWTSYARRVDAEMLAELAPAPTKRPRFYACGPTPFVEAVAEALVRLGHDPLAFKTERFGPTGG
jgi:ferredoxin-NADP reductase